MARKKLSGGRPKHVTEYETGEKAQALFLAGLRAVLNPPKKAKRTKRSAR